MTAEEDRARRFREAVDELAQTRAALVVSEAALDEANAEARRRSTTFANAKIAYAKAWAKLEAASPLVDDAELQRARKVPGHG